MKATDLPLVDAAECQKRLRTTKLRKNFILDTNSFLCAGGEFISLDNTLNYTLLIIYAVIVR